MEYVSRADFAETVRRMRERQDLVAKLQQELEQAPTLAAKIELKRQLRDAKAMPV